MLRVESNDGVHPTCASRLQVTPGVRRLRGASNMRSAICVTLMILWAAALSTSAEAQVESPYFPLTEGYEWEFVGTGGDHAHVWVEGTAMV